jgi:ribosome biogenesis GTPase / thiamine phosphate phosphatase
MIRGNKQENKMDNITLSDLGFNSYSNQDLHEAKNFARVIRENRDRYLVCNEGGIYEAEITGNLRFMAASRIDLPAVGDWVVITVHDENSALILEVLPRKSVLERKAVNEYGEKQVIGANIDYALIIMAQDRDFNLNRLERFISIVNAGRIKPVILLSKSDVLDSGKVRDNVLLVKDRVKIPDVMAFSNTTGEGLDHIRNLFRKGLTYCLLGSSGVGKSTLINVLEGKHDLQTQDLSQSTGKGKHTTTFRELRLLKEGGILIDTPGMREIGVTNTPEGVAMTFEDIKFLAADCRFKDCTHTTEPGCAIQEAILEGRISQENLENFKKLEREVERFSTSVAEKRKKDKQTGKLYKQILKEHKKRKG